MRPRKQDRHLPPCVYLKHGAYWYVKAGKWERIGVTLDEALAEYARRIGIPKGGMADLIERAHAHHVKTTKLADSTQAMYRTAKKILQRKLRPFEPHQVKAKHVAKVKADMASTPNMANRCLSLLRTVFNYAVDQGEVDSNPCVGVKKLKEAKRRRYITDDEFTAIRAQADPRLQVIMDLQYLTGQRISDVLNLRRSQITDDGILLKPQKTKNSSGQMILLRWSPELREAVERAKALNEIPSLTLLRGRGGKAPNYRTVADQFSKAAAAAGVEDVRLNDQRAKAATDAKRQGKSPRKLLGHTSDAMTERYLRQHEIEEADGPSIRQSNRQAQKT